MPAQELTLTVPPDLKGKRLDQALAELCPQHSRSRLQAWIRSGHVRVNDAVPRQRDVVQGGEHVNILVDVEPPAGNWPREAIPLEVVHQDEQLLVIDKPPGLVVHPGAGNPGRTLLNALVYHYPELARLPRAGIVQRLDKDTSGLMVIARTPEAHTWLVERLQARQVTREYQAVVAGVMTAGGTVEAPIGRHPVQRKRMAVVDGGKPAVTHYRVIRRFAAHTHVRLRLESGRTHQIRVHMAHIHHPIVGDPVYGGRPRFPRNAGPRLLETLRHFPRQALHASRLELDHPSTVQPVEWQAPLPEDMRTLLERLDGND